MKQISRSVLKVVYLVHTTYTQLDNFNKQSKHDLITCEILHSFGGASSFQWLIGTIQPTKYTLSPCYDDRKVAPTWHKLFPVERSKTHC